MKRNKNLLILLSLATAIQFGCTKYDQKIADYITESCTNFDDIKACKLKLSEVTNFNWDKVYIFDEYFGQEVISETIGFDCECNSAPDGYTRILFTKNNEVVKMDDYYAYSPIQFRALDFVNAEHVEYAIEDAQFFVLKKKSHSGWSFYDLYPVNGTLQPKY